MSSQVLTPNTEAAILARILESDPGTITPDVARYLLSMRLPQRDEERVNELSAKARAGSLKPPEEQELDSLPAHRAATRRYAIARPPATGELRPTAGQSLRAWRAPDYPDRPRVPLDISAFQHFDLPE